MMRDYFNLLRVSQYSKNLFILLPLFFAGEMTDMPKLLCALKGFAAFSLLASAVYVVNDCIDASFDRVHPRKMTRPIASGRVARANALAFAAVLLGVGLVLMYAIGESAFFVVLVYLGINLAYNAGLKHMPIIDVAVIAVGFDLRLLVGSVVTGVPLSNWIVIMTFLLAYFLALAKRRDDVVIFEETGQMMRPSIDGYNVRFLDTSLAIMAAIVIVSYMMYSVSHDVTARLGSQYLYTTTLFVILGVLRYLQLTFVEGKSGSPAWVLLHDRFTQLNLIGWIAAFWLLLYN